MFIALIMLLVLCIGWCQGINMQLVQNRCAGTSRSLPMTGVRNLLFCGRCVMGSASASQNLATLKKSDHYEKLLFSNKGIKWKTKERDQ
jgi:hypothetical protein